MTLSRITVTTSFLFTLWVGHLKAQQEETTAASKPTDFDWNYTIDLYDFFAFADAFGKNKADMTPEDWEQYEPFDLEPIRKTDTVARR